MRTGAAAGYRGYVHETAFYGSDEEFLALVLPFLSGGLAAGEPTVAAFAPANQWLVRDALGADCGVVFLDGHAQYQRPATAIRQYRDLMTERVAAGAGQIRIAGDVPHPGVGVPWDWWARYEAAANRAFAEFPLWGMCPYDTRTTPAAVLDEVRRTHPLIATTAGHEVNAAFEPPEGFLTGRRVPAWRDPVEAGPAAIELRDPTLAETRQAIASVAALVPLVPDDLEGLLLAGTEAVSNAIVHGRPPVLVRLWAGARRVVVTVTDHGPGPSDPFVGLLPARASGSGGLGLWLAHQLCSFVALQADPAGFTIRLVAGQPAL